MKILFIVNNLSIQFYVKKSLELNNSEIDATQLSGYKHCSLSILLNLFPANIHDKGYITLSNDSLRHFLLSTIKIKIGY